MAKGLDSMVRLAEWGIEQKRRNLGEALGEVDVLNQRLDQLEETLIKEQKFAIEAPIEAGMYYGVYAERVVDQRIHINELIVKASQRVEILRGELNEAYRDLKKFEVARDLRDKRQKAEEDKKEQDMLDEVGLQLHRKNRAKLL